MYSIVGWAWASDSCLLRSNLSISGGRGMRTCRVVVCGCVCLALYHCCSLPCKLLLVLLSWLWLLNNKLCHALAPLWNHSSHWFTLHAMPCNKVQRWLVIDTRILDYTYLWSSIDRMHDCQLAKLEQRIIYGNVTNVPSHSLYTLRFIRGSLRLTPIRIL